MGDDAGFEIWREKDRGRVLFGDGAERDGTEFDVVYNFRKEAHDYFRRFSSRNNFRPLFFLADSS